MQSQCQCRFVWRIIGRPFTPLRAQCASTACERKSLAGAWKQLRWRSGCGQGPGRLFQADGPKSRQPCTHFYFATSGRKTMKSVQYNPSLPRRGFNRAAVLPILEAVINETVVQQNRIEALHCKRKSAKTKNEEDPSPRMSPPISAVRLTVYVCLIPLHRE